MNDYRPVTDDRPLPPELEPLMEALAEQIHDRWAAGRMAEGWRWGPALNAEDKTHPDLVPYDRLPEGEKAYDRGTAAAAIRGILKAGWTIGK